MSAFRKLLSVTSETVERPRALAPGHYVGKIKNTEFGESRQKKTPFLRLIIQPTAETSDVEAGANDGIDFEKKELRRDFYITPDAVYRIGDMLDAVLGKAQGVVFDERIPDLKGADILFGVTQRNSDDGQEVYNDITTIAAYDPDTMADAA